MSQLNEHVDFLLRFMGPAMFVGLQLSSVYAAIGIVSQQTVGKLSPLPFGSLFVNCLIWSVYGRMINSPSVLYPNLSGLFVGTFCVTVYHQFATRKPFQMYAVIICIFLLCVYLNNIGNSSAIGLLGCALSIVVSGSPLAVMRTVIMEKSTATMPFPTSFVTWLNNLSWVLFGYIVVHDPYVYIPNMLGFALSSTQMILFLIYGFPNAKTKADAHQVKNEDPKV